MCILAAASKSSPTASTPLSQPRALLDHCWQDYFCVCAISWHFSTWKSTVLARGSWKKELCENGNEGSASPKHSEILSQACRSQEVLKNKKGGILFISLLQSYTLGYMRY